VKMSGEVAAKELNDSLILNLLNNWSWYVFITSQCQK
jgi:hypothetical protein